MNAYLEHFISSLMELPSPDSLRNVLSNPFLKLQAGVGGDSVQYLIAPPLRSTLYSSLFVGAKKV